MTFFPKYYKNSPQNFSCKQKFGYNVLGLQPKIHVFSVAT